MVKKKKKKVEATDILSHHLVPPMKVLSEGEKTKLLKKFGINENQLPKMNFDDAVAAELKVVPGNIIRVYRDDGTGKHLTYRVVVDDE